MSSNQPPSSYNSKEFLKLQAEWDKKLAKKGFEDIEQRDGNLKVWTSTITKQNYRPIFWEAKEEYYRLAGHFLNEYKFKNNLERHLWELHADGVPISDIPKFLKKYRIVRNKKKYKITFYRVIQILNELSKIMKEQMCLTKT